MRLVYKTAILLGLSLIVVSCERQNGKPQEEKDILEAVDLGLNVKWASQNVGANSKYAMGSYFGWGEISPKTHFKADEYRFGTNKPNGYTKYNDVDNKKKLDLEDDAAHSVMGGNWRMPTYAEIEELIENCAWKWVDEMDDSGRHIKGFTVTGTTRNSIFIPMGNQDDVNNRDGAAYMSSNIEHSLVTDNDYCAVRGLYLENNRQNVFWGLRFQGRQIRAVSD